jgi:hypothetical protein
VVEAPRNRWITAASEARTESGGDAVAFVKLLTGVDGWTLKFEKGNVRVWARQVAGSKFKEVRGNGIVDAPPAKVLAPNPNPNPNADADPDPDPDSDPDPDPDPGPNPALTLTLPLTAKVLALLRASDAETIRQYNPMYASGYDLQQLDPNTKVSW